MRIVCVSAGNQLRKETQDALIANWVVQNIHFRFIEKADQTGYLRILTEFWEQKQDFAVVEPDIVIRKDVAEAMLNCHCEYGCFPYAWTTNVGPALGCTWFRRSFLEKYPDAMREVQHKNVSWKQLDVVLMRHVLARKHGEQPHVHLPPVQHLNEAKALLPEADPHPMMEVPHW